MFHTSTQKAHWVFRSKEELATMRDNANKSYQSRLATTLNINSAAYMTNGFHSFTSMLHPLLLCGLSFHFKVLRD